MRGFFQQVYYTGKERERDCHGRDKGGFTLNRSLVVGNISNCVLDFYGTQIAFRADTNAYVYCSTLDAYFLQPISSFPAHPASSYTKDI